MFTHAGDRESLKQRWKKHLKQALNLLKKSKFHSQKKKNTKLLSQCISNKTIRNLLATLGSGLVGFGLESLQGLGRAARNIKHSRLVCFPCNFRSNWNGYFWETNI
jgi:hypothetical protein